MAGRLVDRVAPVHRADQATHRLPRRDRRPIFSRAPLTCPRVFVYAACDFCSDSLVPTGEVLCDGDLAGRVVARPRPHGRRGVMRRERLKNRQRAAY